MSKSHANYQSGSRHTSLAMSGELFTPEPEDQPAPGSMNDEFVIRGIITASIKSCSKSRPQIAEEMSTLLGVTVTKRALDSYTSESAEQNRWPAQYTRAFCYVTGDYDLLRCVSERAGLHVIGRAERQLLELGRQTIIAERAQAEIARLKSALALAEVA